MNIKQLSDEELFQRIKDTENDLLLLQEEFRKRVEGEIIQLLGPKGPGVMKELQRIFQSSPQRTFTVHEISQHTTAAPEDQARKEG